MAFAQDYTLNELMVVVVSRELRDGELAFVGMGTAGRAFTLAVGIPIAASRLAQLTHAPDLTIFWANLLSPDLDHIPSKWIQHYITTWPAAYQGITTADKCDMVARGQFAVSFDSAPQIDKYGNMNITAIGDYRRPKVRLVGCLAQPDHFAFIARPIILMDLSKRAFVERVDFITSVGYLDGGDSRIKSGLLPGGPWKVITDKCVFIFNPTSKEMQLDSLHPGVSVEEILDLMSFHPIVPEVVPLTKPPSADQVKLVREEIDPNQVLLIA